MLEVIGALGFGLIMGGVIGWLLHERKTLKQNNQYYIEDK